MHKTPKWFAAAMLAAFTLSAFAQAPNTSRIDQRQAKQQERIDQGVKSGQITPREAARLEKGQQRVEKMEAKATADGRLTPKERAAIERAQDRQNRQIARQKHDRQQGKK